MNKIIVAVVVVLVLLFGLSFLDKATGFSSLILGNKAKSADFNACKAANSNLQVLNEKRQALGLPPIDATK